MGAALPQMSVLADAETDACRVRSRYRSTAWSTLDNMRVISLAHEDMGMRAGPCARKSDMPRIAGTWAGSRHVIKNAAGVAALAPGCEPGTISGERQK